MSSDVFVRRQDGWILSTYHETRHCAGAPRGGNPAEEVVRMERIVAVGEYDCEPRGSCAVGPDAAGPTTSGCPGCHRLVVDGWNNCPGCGAELREAEP